jgi:hypothetical protein
MDSGKTTVASEVIKTLHRIGMRLAGAKVTGVGAMRDLYKMEDYGVYESVSFVDCGIPSTANVSDDMMVKVAKGALNYFTASQPDAIIVEFGDGILGRYGVLPILKDPQIQKNVRLASWLRARSRRRDQACGRLREDRPAARHSLRPVTDNEVGKEIIKDATGLMTYNAFSPRNDWLDLVIARWAV